LNNTCTSLCFFFSSRRRHTRCYRDWSSDVCSSDLGAKGRGAGTRPRFEQILNIEPAGAAPDEEQGRFLDLDALDAADDVGSEPEIGRASCRERVYVFVGDV